MKCPVCQDQVALLVEGTDVCMRCDILIDPPLPLSSAEQQVLHEQRRKTKPRTPEQNARRRERRRLAREAAA